jgi:hypothetical protein
LLAVPHHRGSIKSAVDGIPAEAQLDLQNIEAAYKHIDGAINALKDDMKEGIEERIRFLLLEGRYNPYIRRYPFPPIHLNLNYLIDPRTILVNREYGELYDEHKEGITTNRADPLWIPGLSRLPFDPNEQPVPKENRPWWQVLSAFFKNEL